MEKQDQSPTTSRQQFWLKHLNCCHESGMSLKAYAEANGLNLGTFYSYSNRLRGKGMAGFARVVPSTQTANSPLPCRILLPNGVAVELGIGAEAVGAVLAMAAKLP